MLEGGVYIRRKILYLFITILFFVSINTISNAKYIMDSTMNVANLNIDQIKPKIELISIQNTNVNYEKYANKAHTISVKLKITEENLKNINLDKNHIELILKSGSKSIIVNEYELKVNKKEQKEDSYVYQIDIQGIKENGVLNINLKEKTVVDKSDLYNEAISINTGITIDNIAPTGKFKETKIQDGKVNAEITLNENIRNIDGWKKSINNLSLTKEFTNNISYNLPITDYAGNTSNVEINVTQATYINVIYASHNSSYGWSFGYGNYDVAGKDAIKNDIKSKTEALAFNISGNVEKDFVQANAYIHSYWSGENTGRCTTSGLIYKYGYNPGKNLFKSMKSDDLVTINSKKYFQFGGSGMNGDGGTDSNGKNPIPSDLAWEFNYGISGITMKLKDYSQYSIIYQIFVNKVGWVKTASDGIECTYNHTMPMSAFRIALVPKTEKQYIIKQWDKDIGTYNMK